MSAALVSIALCTYNGEIHLAAQIQSLLNQTYTNLEVIIVDDNSTDTSYEIASAFQEKDARIKCYQNSENMGFNRNFEKAIKLTSGDFIAISDQDDIWKPEKIERLMAGIGDNWLAFSNSVYINEADELQDKHLLDGFKFSGYDYRSVLLANYITGHTCLMARAFLKMILPFPTEGYYDWWMGFVALYHNKIVYLDEVLTFYRMHNLSVTQLDLRKKKREFSYLSFNMTLNMMTNFLSYKNLKDVDKKVIADFIRMYTRKRQRSYHIPLIFFVNKYYEYIFPGLRKRKGLSKLNFAVKYSRRLR